MAPSKTKVLVTGGAGYIGSHVVLQLVATGYAVVVYDNLISGHRWAVPGAELVIGDLSDERLLAETFEAHAFDAVLHFAAHIVVPESVDDPLKYYRNNTVNTVKLLGVCARFGLEKFVFSSSAAVYGTPKRIPITEDTLLNPLSPYGASKMMSERVIMDLANATNMRFVILRYFNPAGADPSGNIGEGHEPETHLVPLVAQAALGLRPSITVFGTDYPTPDGTCIRDYIHVCDLAAAHVDALSHLSSCSESVVLNCGYGHGYSVNEVIQAAKAISRRDFPVEYGARRKGDPAVLVASNEQILRKLDWEPKFDDLTIIMKSALDWERTGRRSEGRAARGQQRSTEC